MKSQLKWLATATCAAVWFVCGYATETAVDNFTAVQSVTRNNGGNYAYFQFALGDSRMATSDGSTLTDEVVVSKIAVGQRNPANNQTYSIAVDSWLLIQEVTALGTNNVGGTLGVTVATTAPLTAADKTASVSVGTGSKTITLCTWTLTTPVRLSKSKTYRATFYNASNVPVNQALEMVTVSNVTVTTNTKIHASGDANYSPYVRVTVTDDEPAAGVVKSAKLTADGTWTDLPWDPEGAPTIADTVTLIADAARTVTLADDVTISGLTLSGTGPFNFAAASGQTPMLIAYATAVNSNTDVSAITANLGAVSLTSGKTLTMNGLAFSAMTNNGGALCFKGGTANSALLQSFNGTMTLRDGAVVTLPNSYDLLSRQRFIADSGTSELTLYAGSDGVADADGDETIQVKNGAKLTLKARDLGGWSGNAGANVVVSVRGEGSKITASNYNNDNPGCFAGRVVLADGGEIAGGSENKASLNFFGSVSTNENYPEIYVPSGTGTWSGSLWRDKNLVVKVADGATFVLSGTLKGSPGATLKKIGAGEMKFKTAQTAYTGALTIADGQVTVIDAGTLGTGTVTVNEGKTLEVQVDAATKTIANTISGSGTVKKSGAGTLSLTGTVSAPVTVSAGTLKLGASVSSESITVAGGRLEMSLPSSAKTVTAEGNEGTLVLILTDAQVAAGNLPTQLSWTGDVSKVEVRNSNGALLSRTVSKVNESDVLVLSSGEASTRTWVSGSASWDAGLSGFALGDNVDFGSNDASEAITVPVKTTVGAMTVSGTYAFSLSPGGLTATTITVAGSAKATFTPLAVNYVRLTMANPNTAGNPPALAELQLMKGGEVVPWPIGTTIQQVNRDGTTVAPNWTSSGNEAVNALIDGVWDGQATYTNPETETGNQGTYNGGAGNNKWWPTTSPDAYAVIHLGAAIDFDGYQLRAADHNPRSPKDWSLEASADGTTWAVVDSQADRTIPAAKSLYVYEGSNTIFPVAPITAVSAPIVVKSYGILGGSAKITGDVTFEMGSILDAITEQPLEITGTVTATGTEESSGLIMVTLPENAVVWPVLKTTTEGLAANFFSLGYEFHYREGTYWAVWTEAKTVTAEVTEAEALSNLTWTQKSDSKNVACADLLKLWDFALNDLSATLNTTTAAAVTIDCATVPALTLSGSAAVTLSAANEVTPTIASLTVSADSTVAAALLNCVTGATTVEANKTLTLSGTDVSLTKLPTGTGSVKISDGSSVTYENGDGAYSGRTTVEGTLTLACELGFTQDGSANPTYPIDIAQGGTVTLANGASTYRSFRGKGDIEVTGDATLGIPGAASVVGGFAVTGNVRVNSGATLKVTSWTSNAVLSGANFQVEGQVTQDVYGFSLTVAANTTLSGTGTIAVPVSFENGAVIATVANGAVTCSDEVTLPETGAVTVQATAYGAKVLKKSGLDVAKFALPTEAGASNWKTEGLFTEKDGALLLVAKPTFTPPEGTPAMSDETTRRIAELAAASDRYGITTVEVAEGRNPAAVELFNNVMTVNDNTPTKATISYDFGVSDITVKSANLTGTAQLYVVVCAKVSNGKAEEATAAGYAEGTTVSLLLDGNEASGAVALDALTLSDKFGLTAGLGEQWFALPMENPAPGTREFTVHAKNTPQAEAAP